MIFIAGSMEAGRRSTEVVAESFHVETMSMIKRKLIENDVAFKTLKPTPSDTVHQQGHSS